MKNSRAVFLLGFILILASPSFADTIHFVSNGDESWVGGSTTTTIISRHPVWQPENPDGSGARWISFADTGYMGTVFVPRSDDVPRMTVYETFDTGPGRMLLTLRVWADDTAQVLFDNSIIFPANISQDYCADGAIGCEPDEFGFIQHYFTSSGGLHTLSFDVYQLGYGTDTETNPFGLLYYGDVTAVPEPGSLALLSTGVIGIFIFLRRRTASNP